MAVAVSSLLDRAVVGLCADLRLFMEVECSGSWVGRPWELVEWGMDFCDCDWLAWELRVCRCY